MSRETDPVLSGMSGRVADYRLDGYIGQGAAAVVYLAQDERSGRNVALKVLAPELARDDTFRDQFLHEARAAAAVDHPHIIPVYDAGEADGMLYLAMHYVQGGDARSLLNRFGPLPFTWAWTIIAQVASALDAAHARGLIHRDVKPSNMLLDAGGAAAQSAPRRPDGGNFDHVYLSDFGMSTNVPPGDAVATGQYGGALDYVAPEQIEGRAVDGRADLYALASTGFELLCGTPPFGQDQGLTVMYAQMYAPPPSAAARRPELPAAVDQVLATALAKNPADRYATCGEFAADLHAALGLRPGEEEPAAYQAGAAGPDTRPTAYDLGPAAPANGFDPGPADPANGYDPEPAGPANWFDPGPAGPANGHDPEPAGPANGHDPAGRDPARKDPAGPNPARKDPARRDTGPTAYDIGPAGPTGAYDVGPAGPTGAYDVGPATYGPGPAAYAPRPAGYDAGPGESGNEPAPAPVMSGPGWPPPPQEYPTARIGPADEDPMEWPDSLFREPKAQPPPPRRPGRRLILAVAAATVLVAAVIAGVLLLQGSSSPGHPARSSSATPPAPAPASTTAARQAAAVNTLMASSAVTREDLVSAITQVQNCARLPAAVSRIQQVVSRRSAEYDRASAMSTAALANGATVKSDLLAALRNSLQADRDYLTWAQQQLAGCRPGAPSRAYNAAIGADQQADAAKATFVRVWNPVAAKYGLPAATTSSL